MRYKHAPHPKNAPGPFYVVQGCCTACMVPHEMAPTLMGFDEADGHCFFSRQPDDEEGLYRAVRAVWSSELECLRYGGHSPEVLRRLAEIGAAEACDHPPPQGSGLVLRNHVTFTAPFATQAQEIAAALREHILGLSSEYIQYRTTPLEAVGEKVKFAYSWFGDDYHPLWLGPAQDENNRWLIRHSHAWGVGSVSVSLMLDDWLHGDARFESVRWYTAETWAGGGGQWRERPY